MIVIITQMIIIIAKNIEVITSHISKDSNIGSGISFSVNGHNLFYRRCR
jgi:hypothetical protein